MSIGWTERKTVKKGGQNAIGMLIFATQKLMQQILGLLKVLTEEIGFVWTFDCVPLLSGLFLILGELKYLLCISAVSRDQSILQ